MKKPFIILALLAGSLSVHAQGTLNIQDRLSNMTIHIYAPQTDNPAVEATGNANSSLGVTADAYANNGTDGNYAGGATQGGTALTGTVTTGGTTVYDGGAIGNTLTSNPTAAGVFHYNNGSDYTVQVWAAPSLNAAASALQPVTQYTTFIATSSATGGTFKNLAAPSGDPGIPGAAGDGSATIALVCWYNDGGTITSYWAAFGAGVPVGNSPLDNISGLGNLNGSPGANMEGLESFALTDSDESYIPEPSTIALAAVGAAVFLLRLVAKAKSTGKCAGRAWK